MRHCYATNWKAGSQRTIAHELLEGFLLLLALRFDFLLHVLQKGDDPADRVLERVGLKPGLWMPGPRFQISSFALTLFRAFDFVCPFARSPFFGPLARFPAGKRFFQ